MDKAQSPEKLSDQEIIDRVLKGDRELYGALIDLYRNLAYSLALQLLKDLDMAEDAVQEAFITGYENLERLKVPSLFSSGIAGITKNVCRNVLKERRKEPVSLDYLAEIGIEPPDSGKSTFYDPELVTAIRGLIPKLPGKCREIIELRYAEDFSCRKIAGFLHLSETAVFSRLFYARKRLLKMLRKEGKI